jgi:D-inositol-3-phosphate glycosyltransferase
VAGARTYARETGREVCRRRLAVAPDRRLLVCAGTRWPIKGQALLLAALNELRTDHPRLECVLIGQPTEPYAQALQRFIRRHGLGDRVRVLPFARDLRQWWRAADVAVCPSESESMPATVLEAMAFGLPVLASRVGGVPEVVEPGSTGWLFEPSDLGSMIAGLDHVAVAEPAELQALGERAARRVAATHDSAHALARMTDLLRQVALARP